MPEHDPALLEVVAGEQARIRAILNAPEARHAGNYAVQLALGTDMPAAKAIALLKAFAPTPHNFLAEAMGHLPNPGIAPDSNMESAEGVILAAEIAAGFNRLTRRKDTK